jgi:hydroxyacylglutathione hydrolase
METENKKGPNVKHQLPFLTSMSVDECRKLKQKNAQVLDIRNPTSFSTAHIPGCINIWSEGVGIFAGWFLDYDNPIILIDENNAQLKNVIRYLFRLGYDNLYGYLKNGFSSWYANAEEVESIDVWMVSQLFDHLEDDSIFIVDVREQSTRLNDGYIKGSTHIFVGDLEENLSLIPKEKTVVLYCGLGNKTSIGCSILKKHNYPKMVNLLGGMSAWTKAEYPIVENSEK